MLSHGGSEDVGDEAMLGILGKMREYGFAVFRLSPADRAIVSSAIEVLSPTLREVHTQGIRTGHFGPIAPSLAAFRERSQLRLESDDAGQPVAVAETMPRRKCEVDEIVPTAEATAMAAEASREELKAVAARASAVLSRVVQAVLSALHHSRGTESTPTTGTRLLDTFYYPGEASWRTLCCSEQLPAPCPAHEDPGLLTAICNDTNALQVQLHGRWVDIELELGEVAIVAGRALARLTHGIVPACTHCVRSVALSRTALVFEVRPDQAAFERIAATEAARAAQPTDGYVAERYSKAAGALLAIAPPSPRSRCTAAAQSCCTLM